jgi:hypothetical protein
MKAQRFFLVFTAASAASLSAALSILAYDSGYITQAQVTMATGILIVSTLVASLGLTWTILQTVSTRICGAGRR